MSSHRERTASISSATSVPRERSRAAGRSRLARGLGRALGGRDLDHEGRARAVAVVLDPDAPIDAAHELAADVEPEAGTADPAGHLRVETVELLEDEPPLRWRDAEPAVAHLE